MSDIQPTSLDGLMTRYTLQSDVRKGDEIVHCLDDRAKAALNRLLIQERIDEASKVFDYINPVYDAGDVHKMWQAAKDRIAVLEALIVKGEE